MNTVFNLTANNITSGVIIVWREKKKHIEDYLYVQYQIQQHPIS